MEKYNKIENLLYKAIAEKLSDDEKIEFETFLTENAEYRKIYTSLSDEKSLAKQYAFYDTLDLKGALRENSKRRNVVRPGKYILASLVTIAAMIVVSLLIFKPSEELQTKNTIANNETPKSNAYVKLIIDNDEILPITDTSKIIHYQNRQDSVKVENLKIVVGVGPVFKFNLPDGTICYMNSNSEIEYPATFSESNRKIVMKGELFFDVVSDSSRPFIIQCGSYNVRVLGTKLNVKDYRNDLCSFVTLIEGSVEIEKDETKFKMSPNQQATIGNDGVIIKEVDANAYAMWINNRFVFHLSELQDIVNTLKRWYNIDIQIDDESLRTRKFTGIIPKYNNIDSVFNILEETTDIKFVKGSNKTIKIIKNN